MENKAAFPAPSFFLFQIYFSNFAACLVPSGSGRFSTSQGPDTPYPALKSLNLRTLPDMGNSFFYAILEAGRPAAASAALAWASSKDFSGDIARNPVEMRNARCYNMAEMNGGNG
jgi:hypothetical protein